MSSLSKRRSLEPPQAIEGHSPQRQRTDSSSPSKSMFPLNWDSVIDTAGPCSAQCWYQRAYKAVQQRASKPAKLREEYGHVCAQDYSIEHTCRVAESKQAAGRNRYCDVLPFDYNRVLLQQQGAPYINASTIQYSSPDLPQTCSYIAAQGPLPRTAADFWAMVLEQQVPVVVMLTNCIEAGVTKCGQYFPDNPNSKLEYTSKAGSYEVTVEQQQSLGADTTLRNMQLTCTSTGASHSFSHYHYHAWPDHGVPKSSGSIRTLCRALDPVRASGRPVVVHCSAGIGRTGTFCSVDILMQRLDAWPSCSNGNGPDQAEVEDTLDVPALVHKLRTQRMGMVQTPDQYVFVYKALLDDLGSRIQKVDQGLASKTCSAQ